MPWNYVSLLAASIPGDNEEEDEEEAIKPKLTKEASQVEQMLDKYRVK